MAPGIPGTESLEFENIEGIILVKAGLTGSRDTTGLLVLDTGAGYLALDHEVADRLDLTEDVFVPGSVDFADHALARLRLGAIEIDQLSPVLVLDASVVRRVTDRSVLGLLGERALRGRAIAIDYASDLVHLIPATRDSAPIDDEARVARSRATFGGFLSSSAQPVPFRLVGDGKMIVRGRLRSAHGGRWSDSLTWVLDTGATKCVLFRERLAKQVPGWERWPSLSGLSAPTLIGDSEARVVRMPEIELTGVVGSVTRDSIDAAVIESPLADALERVTEMPVIGLVGYSFLRRYRLGIDYERSLVWLDPRKEPWDERPYEYCHVGLQIERNGKAAEVVGVATGSPAALAGIAIGDTIVAIGPAPAHSTDLTALARDLEGKPGTAVTIRVRHEGIERTHRLVRRWLM